MGATDPIILWLRRDLRLVDNAALNAALEACPKGVVRVWGAACGHGVEWVRGAMLCACVHAVCMHACVHASTRVCACGVSMRSEARAGFNSAAGLQAAPPWATIVCHGAWGELASLRTRSPGRSRLARAFHTCRWHGPPIPVCNGKG